MTAKKSVAANSKISCELIENNTTKDTTHNIQPVYVYENETEH